MLGARQEWNGLGSSSDGESEVGRKKTGRNAVGMMRIGGPAGQGMAWGIEL